MTINIKSLITARLQMYFNTVNLAVGTGFFYVDDNNYYLVTNWHNVTGRNPLTCESIHTGLAIPNRIVLSLHGTDESDSIVEMLVPLYSDSENKMACWFEHPEYKQNVDVVVIPFSIPADVTTDAVNNEVISNTPDMAISIAQDVFVLGYPEGLSGKHLFPIWKRATVATEPDLDLDDFPKMLIDTATREGMSGAPVFAISKIYQDLQGQTKMVAGDGGAVKFVGVYSGRNIGDTEIAAQLGVVWKAQVIKEIIDSKCVGCSSFFD